MPYKTLLACLLLTCTLAAQAAAPKPQQAAVATAHPAATVAGLETLAHGGNAFDAAVAIAAALAVAEPYGSGLGGGGFFLLRQAGEKSAYHFVDARERAPLAAGPDLYRRNGTVQRELSLNGPLAAAIPGLPAALAHLAERYGKLPLSDSLTPAIRLARDGVGIDRVYRERAEWRLQALQQDPASAAIFLDQGQVPPLHGLLRHADTAMYRAKESGRNCVAIFDESMLESVTQRLAVETALYRALERRELRLVHQPIIDIGLGEVVGFEALMRWDREDGSTISPAEFIPIAEETGTIVPIGSWALLEALTHLVEPPLRRIPGAEQHPQGGDALLGGHDLTEGRIEHPLRLAAREKRAHGAPDLGVL